MSNGIGRRRVRLTDSAIRQERGRRVRLACLRIPAERDSKGIDDGYGITRPQGRDDTDIRRGGHRNSGDRHPGRPLPGAADPHHGPRRLRSRASRLSRQTPPSRQPQPNAATLPSSTAAAPVLAPRPALQPLDKAGANRSDWFASFAAPPKASPSASSSPSSSSPDGGAVDVTGITKGRGTAGVMVRHNFKGQRATHGVKKVHRHGGGTSMNTFPARVFKGSAWPAASATSRSPRAT